MGIENQGEFNRNVNGQDNLWKRIHDSKKEYPLLSKEQLEKITQKLPRKAGIFEIGSYDGLFLKQLKDSGNGYDLTGSDTEDEFLETVKKITPEREPIKLDIKKDEIPQKFDVIFMKLVLGCLDLEREIALVKKGLSLSPQEKEETWDKALKKVKNSCKQFVLITPALKKGIKAEDLDVTRHIFIPDDILEKLLGKHFNSKELLDVQETGDKDFNMKIYLLSDPKID